MSYTSNSREPDYVPLADMTSPGPPSYSPASAKPVPFQMPNKKRNIDYWAWEWIALMVSLIAVIASAVTLMLFDGKAIPKWSWRSNGISVNAILSLLSALSRASLLMPIDECMGQLMWLRYATREQRLADVSVYAEAAKGPGGALRLIWRQRGITLGCLGSLLLIGSLGIGTAQQQLLSYPSRDFVDQTLNSTVTRAERFDSYQNISTSDTATPIMSFSLLSSIYSAALIPESDNAATASDIAPFFTCGGSCEFPAFNTLAVCSECHDTSDQIQSSCDGNGFCLATFQGLTASSWRANSGTNINTILNQSSISTGSSPYTFSAQTPFTTFAHLQANSSTSIPPVYTGTQCALYWCVKTVQASVKTGIYTETVVSTYDHFVTDSALNPGGISFTDPKLNGTFLVSRGAQQSIIGESGVAVTLKGWAKSTPSGGDRLFSSDLMQGFSKYTNISHAMDRVATSMTNRIRDLDTLKSVKKGETHARQSFIRVRWAWFIYPVTLWTLSLIFLICIVVRTRNGEKRKGIRCWGANPIALMFYGLDDDTKSRVQDGSWEQMQDLSERLWVKLEVGSEGVRLRGKKIDN